MFSCCYSLNSFEKSMKFHKEQLLKYQDKKKLQKNKNNLDNIKIEYCQYIIDVIRFYINELKKNNLTGYLSALSEKGVGKKTNPLDRNKNIYSAFEILNVMFHVIYGVAKRYEINKKIRLSDINIINRSINMSGDFDSAIKNLLLTLSSMKNEIDTSYLSHYWKSNQEVMVDFISSST